MKAQNLLIIAILVMACENSTSKRATKDDSTRLGTVERVEPDKSKSKWIYEESIDEMTSSKRYFASIISDNEANFNFPYSGGSSLTLVVRNYGNGNELVVGISKGQFMLSIMSNEVIRIKFDDDQPMTVSFNSSDNGSTQWIFPNNSQRLITRLKSAKKVMIEAPFYDSPRQVFHFNTEGLVWDK